MSIDYQQFYRDTPRAYQLSVFIKTMMATPFKTTSNWRKKLRDAEDEHEKLLKKWIKEHGRHI